MRSSKIKTLAILVVMLALVANCYALDWDSSPNNWDNSINNWENSPNNWKNSPNNWDNSPNNWNRDNGIYDESGDSVGYVTPKAGGGYNIYNNSGIRILYKSE